MVSLNRRSVRQVLFTRLHQRTQNAGELINIWCSTRDTYVVIPHFGFNTFIHHKYLMFLNLFTHLFYMSVHFNNFMSDRHRLQVFPSVLLSVAYCPWSCLDVSSCFSLLWTSTFLDEYNLITDDGICCCVCTISIGAPFWFMCVWQEYHQSSILEITILQHIIVAIGWCIVVK